MLNYAASPHSIIITPFSQSPPTFFRKYPTLYKFYNLNFFLYVEFLSPLRIEYDTPVGRFINRLQKVDIIFLEWG